MKHFVLAASLALAGLALGGCATQSTAQHHAPPLAGPATRVVEFPDPPGAGQPREVRVLVDEPTLLLPRLLQGGRHA